MRKIRIILNNGRQVVVPCECASFGSVNGKLTEFKLNGMKTKQLLYVCPEDISMVIDEGEITEDGT